MKDINLIAEIQLPHIKTSASSYNTFLEFTLLVGNYIGKEKEKEKKPKTKISKASQAIITGISYLIEMAGNGDSEALENLAKIAVLSTQVLAINAKNNPEIAKSVAESMLSWPVLATNEMPAKKTKETKWKEDAQRIVNELCLGRKMECYKARFRKATGRDEDKPSRLWAQETVRAIEQSIARMVVFDQLYKKLESKEFKSKSELARILLDNGFNIVEHPMHLVETIKKLPSFSIHSLPEWRKAVRSIIPYQIPNFHTCPEWRTEMNKIKRVGATVNNVQTDILDKIVLALETIAPETPLESTAPGNPKVEGCGR